MSALAGEIADPGGYNRDIKKLVSRGGRSTSSSTTTTTEIGVLRLDGVALKAGRGYRIGCTTLYLTSSVNGDGIAARLRASTSGTATTTSTELVSLPVQTLTSQGSGGGKIERYYYPASDETLSVLLTVVRLQGTGNVSITAINSNIDLQVEDIGPDTGNAGTAL